MSCCYTPTIILTARFHEPRNLICKVYSKIFLNMHGGQRVRSSLSPGIETPDPMFICADTVAE